MASPTPPPNYKEATTGHRCANCKMGWKWSARKGKCWGYGEYPIAADYVCDSWARDTPGKRAALQAQEATSKP